MFELTYPEHLTFTRYKTPVQFLKRTSEQYGRYKLWIKRDDMTGMELSGNKVRKLDFLLKEALNRNSRHIFTCGGIQSNHCRTTAYMAAQLGLKCTLFLRGSRPVSPAGNYLLDLLSGAEIIFVSADEYRRIDSIMMDEADRRDDVYVVPEGGSNATGAWGYIRCFEEIVRQCRHMDLPIDTVVVATGSGGTHAGLLIGRILMASSVEIISVNVCDDAAFFRNKIRRIAEEFHSKYRIGIALNDDDIKIIDGFVGAGYGVAGTPEIDLIGQFARQEGILLDPVYGVKAFRGLQSAIARKELPGENILFIHTGGIFGLFPVAGQFQKE